MTLEYTIDHRLKNLQAILDEYTEWFMQVMRRVTYPDNGDDAAFYTKPVSFLQWAEAAAGQGFKPDLVDRLVRMHDDLSLLADKLINDAMKYSKLPAYKDFTHLIMLFEEFFHHVRRIERDIVLEDSGLDPLTGLRIEAVLEKDLTRELDRLARQGKPFCLALVRIDRLDDIRASNPPEKVNECLVAVSAMIKRCMRSYDDAYRLERDEFVLALKQASTSGGVRALERLKRELEKERLNIPINGKKTEISLSSCIAEPVPGDNIAQLLKNLHNDLDNAAKGEGSVLEYFEMSPLQRYVKEFGE